MFSKDITLLVGPLMSGKTILCTNLSSYSKYNIHYYANDGTKKNVEKKIYSLKSGKSLTSLSRASIVEKYSNITVFDRERDLLNIEFNMMGEDVNYIIIDGINFLETGISSFMPKLVSIISKCKKMGKEYKVKFLLTLNVLTTQELDFKDIMDLFPDIEIITLNNRVTELDLIYQNNSKKILKVNRQNLRVTEKNTIYQSTVN